MKGLLNSIFYVNTSHSELIVFQMKLQALSTRPTQIQKSISPEKGFQLVTNLYSKYLMGSNILEPLWFKKQVFCFIFEHETRQTKGFHSIS